jgi:hypothetical protein
MIDVLSTTQLVLRDAGYTTKIATSERREVLYFEDATLMGFGCVFDSQATLLTQWRGIEMSLLARNASSLRAAGDKAWNVYLLLLTASRTDTVEDRQVRWIEENLERTRKLAASGLGTREDVSRALLPILPIQQQPSLQQGDFTERLQRRVRSIAPRAAEIAFNDSVSPGEVVRLLGEPV